MVTPSPLIPRKLRRGDTIRVIAPARSRPFVAEHDHSAVLGARFAALGLRVTFGDHVDERDDFECCPTWTGTSSRPTPRSSAATPTSPPCRTRSWRGPA